MRVRFVREFEWRPHPRRVTVFREGCEMQVTRACAAAAMKAGAAIKLNKRGRKDDESTDAARPQPDPVSGR